MSKSVKFKNNLYLDSTSIVHNKKKLSDILYPVGSVYISTNSTSPATLFGGSWTQISGRFLYCTTTSKTTGGSTTTGSTTLTTSQIPAHNHTITVDSKTLTGDLDSLYGSSGVSPVRSANGVMSGIFSANTKTRSLIPGNMSGSGNGLHIDASHNHTASSANTGGGSGHTHSQNLPPYFTVYAWYRTA